MIELENIPHIGEISNHGLYHGARQKNTATFQARSTRQNKLVPSLEEAIRALEADPLMAEVLGPHIYTQYIAGKEKEWEEYCTRVSSWEIAKYMVLY